MSLATACSSVFKIINLARHAPPQVRVISVVLSPDGKLLASASLDNTVRLWDVATRQPVGQPLSGHTDSVWGVAFSPDGKLLASASRDETVRLWMWPRASLWADRCPATQGPYGAWHSVRTASCWPRRAPTKRAAVGCGHAPARGPAALGHTNLVISVAFSPDGKLLASASADKTVRLWMWSRGSPWASSYPVTPQPSEAWRSVQMASCWPRRAETNGAAVDVATRQQLGQPLSGHTDSVASVAFSPDGKLLASASADKTVRLWDVATRQQLGQPLSGHTDYVISVAFSPDGKLLASASSDNTVRLWMWSRGSPWPAAIRSHRSRQKRGVQSRWQAVGLGERRQNGAAVGCGHAPAVGPAALGPHGFCCECGVQSGRQAVGLGERGQNGAVVDVATRQQLGQPLSGHTDYVISVAFSPDGKLLASASSDNTVRLWDMATRQPVGQPLSGHTNAVISVAFSPDGKLLASASSDNMVRLWDVATRQPWANRSRATRIL